MKKTRHVIRKIRHDRIRKRIKGTIDRLRLSIFMSNRNIYLQLINDDEGKTITSASTLDKEIREKISNMKMLEKASTIGKLLGERAVKSGIDKIVFDRSGYRFCGKLKALAEGVKEKGISF